MSTATDMLAKYLAAEAALLAGKDVSFNGRTLRMENLQEIRAGRQEWERKVAAEKGQGSGLGRRGFTIATFDGDGQ